MQQVNRKPKVSVITTFYNAEKFIVNALHSINAQEIPNDIDFEYVIVDDWSQDKSTELVVAYMKLNKLNGDWRLIKPEKNLGCGGARRYGIEHATGDYFMFLDADDYYVSKTFVDRAYKTITSHKADIVEYGIIINQANGTRRNNVVPNPFTIENNPSKALISLFNDNVIKFNVWSKIYTREIVESYKYSDERTFEDVRTIPVWVANAKKIVVMNTVEINYRAASGSIIRSDNIKTRIGTITAIASHFERFKNDFNVLKAMYNRAMVDLECLLHNHSSENEGFNEMSKLNTYMLKYIYPDTWQDKTYEV